ncbi:hypothetical protein PFISCL1PPCAC_18805, partial [Pristionchus fissidentatus]
CLLSLSGESSPSWISFDSFISFPMVGWILIDVVAFLVLSIFNALIIHLIWFHRKLRKDGTTTYSYIQKQRKGVSLLLQRATTDTITGNSNDARVAPAPAAQEQPDADAAPAVELQQLAAAAPQPEQPVPPPRPPSGAEEEPSRDPTP